VIFLEGTVQFIANYDDWKAVRKITITDKTTPLTVMEFLSGFSTSIDNKIEQNMRKVIDLDKLDKAITELISTEKDTAKILEELNTRKINSLIREISNKDTLEKKQKTEMEDFCRVYATKKVLKNLKLNVDYSEIEIPGMGRLKKKVPKEVKEEVKK
jgi:hypothetical protein